jgi:hypothetical protein
MNGFCLWEESNALCITDAQIVNLLSISLVCAFVDRLHRRQTVMQIIAASVGSY